MSKEAIHPGKQGVFGGYKEAIHPGIQGIFGGYQYTLP